MLPLYTIATPPETLEEKCKIPGAVVYTPRYQVHPGDKVPILLLRKGSTEVVEAIWGLAAKSGKAPVLFVSMKNILKTKPYNIMLRNSRCALPANCFFGEMEKQAYLIRLTQERLFCMGALFQENTTTGQLHFAILLTEAADFISPLLSAMPVVVGAERHAAWLKAAHLHDIMRVADSSVNHWFDYFKVDNAVLEPDANSRELLVPMGMSAKQVQEREDQVAALKLEQSRMDRKSSKR